MLRVFQTDSAFVLQRASSPQRLLSVSRGDGAVSICKAPQPSGVPLLVEAVFGLLRLSDTALSLITVIEREEVAKLACGAPLNRAAAFRFFPVGSSSEPFSSLPLLRELYWSEGSATCTAQQLDSPQNASPNSEGAARAQWAAADRAYTYNLSLVAPFLEAGGHDFVVPCFRGWAGSVACSPTTTATLLLRRHTGRFGTRCVVPHNVLRDARLARVPSPPLVLARTHARPGSSRAAWTRAATRPTR